MPSCEANSNPCGLVKEIAPETLRRRSWLAGKLTAGMAIEVVFKSAGNYTVFL